MKADCIYVVSKLNDGFVVRTVGEPEESRWYFESRDAAHEWIEYLNRCELARGHAQGIVERAIRKA